MESFCVTTNNFNDFFFIVISRIFTNIFFQGMQIHMKSDRGEIEVFLCPEEETLHTQLGVQPASEESATEDNDSDANVLQSPIKIKQEVGDSYNSPFKTMTPPIRVSTQIGAASHEAWEAHSRNDNGENQTIKNVLIWESEDLGPIGNRFQQQTVDQENHHGNS